MSVRAGSNRRKFGDDIDVAALDQVGRVASNQLRVDAEGGNRFEAAVGDASQFQRRAELAFEHRAILPEQPHDALADGAAAEQGQSNRFQEVVTGGGGN